MEGKKGRKRQSKRKGEDMEEGEGWKRREGGNYIKKGRSERD